MKSTRKYTPGLIPWIALLLLLFYIVSTMDRMVLHLSLMELKILELEVEVMEEDDEWFKDWDEMGLEDKEDRLRIAIEKT